MASEYQVALRSNVSRLATVNHSFYVFLLQEAQQYADENSLLFMETSAKTAQNVNEIFLDIGNYSNLYSFLELKWLQFQLMCFHQISNTT